MILVATKYLHGKPWIKVYREPAGNALVIRNNEAKGCKSLEWRPYNMTPEEFIAMNGSRSQKHWKWED